ncbi:MAG: helix-turn-helix domain-containing protein [Candidatus Gallimonas sp.]
MTKYRLEKDTKLTEETVNRWQKGIYEPTVESLVRLSSYFHCSVDFILGREN